VLEACCDLQGIRGRHPLGPKGRDDLIAFYGTDKSVSFQNLLKMGYSRSL
jgi:hypothetical protein